MRRTGLPQVITVLHLDADPFRNWQKAWYTIRLCLTEEWYCREVEAELPFMGQEAPRPSTRPRWIDADEAMLKLLAIRQAPAPTRMRN